MAQILDSILETLGNTPLVRLRTISRKTGCQWMRRFSEQGTAGLEDRPRLPVRSSARTPLDTERGAPALRERHPA